MQLHLVDATYELFRAHYAPAAAGPRPRRHRPVGRLRAVDQLLYLLREQGATHVGCATDRVIESFRNDLFPGYKSSAGMPPELLAQFPIAEAAIEALGIVLWPMVEFEADDAIAAAAVRFAEDAAGRADPVCTPDKDMAQLVRDERIVLWDRRRDLTYDDAGVRAKWGVAPTSIPDYLALVGDARTAIPGLPGWGAKGAAAVLARYGHLEDVPDRASAWDVAGIAGGRAMSLAASLRDTWTKRCCIATWPDCERLRTASRSGRPTPTSCAGRGLRGRLGGVLRRVGPRAPCDEAPSVVSGVRPD